MAKSSEKWRKVAKSGNKWLGVAICGFMWLKVVLCWPFWISGHFRSIRNFNLFWKFLTKWLPSVILNVRNSLSIAFLAISDRYATFFFDKMVAGGHFGLDDNVSYRTRPRYLDE